MCICVSENTLTVLTSHRSSSFSFREDSPHGQADETGGSGTYWPSRTAPRLRREFALLPSDATPSITNKNKTQTEQNKTYKKQTRQKRKKKQKQNRLQKKRQNNNQQNYEQITTSDKMRQQILSLRRRKRKIGPSVAVRYMLDGGLNSSN